jgi:hypothetical protein
MYWITDGHSRHFAGFSYLGSMCELQFHHIQSKIPYRPYHSILRNTTPLPSRQVQCRCNRQLMIAMAELLSRCGARLTEDNNFKNVASEDPTLPSSMSSDFDDAHLPSSPPIVRICSRCGLSLRLLIPASDRPIMKFLAPYAFRPR